MTIDERELLISQGWKQGAVIRNIFDDGFTANAHILLEDDDVFLVISQTCDLVNPDYNSEPFFEVLRLISINSTPAPEYGGGKNSREIQFKAEFYGKVQTFRALPFKRFFVDRELLRSHSPEGYLLEDEREMISAWLTKRFIRTAFPDKFDRRWKVRKGQIEKIIKRLTLVSDIYIKVIPFEEVNDGVEYEVEIYLLMDADHYDDPVVYDEYERHKIDLDTQLGKCLGINLQVIELVSDAGISVRELQELRRWDNSYLSYRAPEEHAAPGSPV